MAYALIHRTGKIDEWRSFGISQADVFLEPESGTYCFAGPWVKVLQVTLEVEETTKPQQPGETLPRSATGIMELHRLPARSARNAWLPF
jgi:hypothetical protein